MFEKILRLLFFCSLLFFVYLGIIYTVVKDGYFYQKIQEVKLYIQAQEKRKEIVAEKVPTNLWTKIKDDKFGVTVFDKEKAFPGYTFFAENAAKAVLIDMQGYEVHSWSLPFYQVWPEPKHIPKDTPGRFLHWHKAHLFNNGDVLAIYENSSYSPYGAGIVKIDKNSNLLWKFADAVHHDLSVGDDGEIYTLVHSVEAKNNYNSAKINPPFFDEYVLILDKDGKEVKRISIIKAILNSQYSNYLLDKRKNGFSNDFTHPNEASFIDANTAAHFDFIQPGQLLLSIRELHAIAILDVEKEEIIWAAKKDWRAQHDPDLLDNGNILLFDNHGHRGAGGASRVIEFDQNSKKIMWSYTGNKEAPFFSGIRGSQQRLPNGNTLITESMKGRMFEITHQGETVWEYHTYRRAENQNVKYKGVVVKAERFSGKDLDFLVK